MYVHILLYPKDEIKQKQNVHLNNYKIEFY